MATASETKPAEASEQSVRYARYAVVVLMFCYTLSFIDRQILSLLVGSIKRDLGVSDTRIGLLQGLAFGIFYTILGMPLGRLADTRSRKTLISVGITFWSIMTALCAAASSFGSLFLMGGLAISRSLAAVAWLVAGAIMTLNAKLLFDVLTGAG